MDIETLWLQISREICVLVKVNLAAFNNHQTDLSSIQYTSCTFYVVWINLIRSFPGRIYSFCLWISI